MGCPAFRNHLLLSPSTSIIPHPHHFFKNYLSFKAFFAWLIVPIQKHLEKVVRWKKALSNFLVSQFSCACILFNLCKFSKNGRKEK